MKTSCLFPRQFGHLPLILLLASGLARHATAGFSANVVINEIMYLTKEFANNGLGA
jgi:hypothetical protein